MYYSRVLRRLNSVTSNLTKGILNFLISTMIVNLSGKYNVLTQAKRFFQESFFFLVPSGQRYFVDNYLGIIRSHLGGLFSLICEPTGAAALDKTNNSSTSNSARKRYTDTGIHVISWCTEELKPGSKYFFNMNFTLNFQSSTNSTKIDPGNR